jgi:hypothetical protein
MSTLSRRTLVTSAVALPALAVPQLTPEAFGPDHPDAELLPLGLELEQFEREWSLQQTIDAKQFAVWEAACIAAGLPRIEFGSVPVEEYRAY